MFNEHSFFPSLSASENGTPMTTDTHRVPAAAQVLAEIHCRATSFICSCSPDPCACTAKEKHRPGVNRPAPPTLFSVFILLFKKWQDFLFFVFTHCLKGIIQYFVDHRTIATLKGFFLKSNVEYIHLKCIVQLNFQWHHSTVPPLTESCHQIPFQSTPPAPAALAPAQRRTLPRGRP